MSTRFNIRVPRTRDYQWINSEPGLLMRYKSEPTVGLLYEDRETGSYVIVTYFILGSTVSFVKEGDIDHTFGCFLLRNIRKALEVLNENLIAWVKKTDSTGIEFVEFLDFKYETTKVGYDKYVWQSQ